jgi:hypothetical protein
MLTETRREAIFELQPHSSGEATLFTSAISFLPEIVNIL